MKQIGKDQVKELVTELERINTAITENDNAIIELNTAIGSKQDTLVSGTNIKTINNNSILGSGNLNVDTFKPFNSNWNSSFEYTTEDFCDSINSDPTAVKGMAFLGILYCNDLPGNLMQGDVVAEVIGEYGESKVIHLILTSADQDPYRWEYSYFNDHTVKGWIGFQPELTAGTGIAIENNVISNTQTSAEWGNIEGEITEQNDLMELINSKQDTLIAGENIKIENNVISSAVTSFGSSINLKYENIAVSNWIVDNRFQDFIYKADIDCPDVTSDMYAIVNYSYEDSTSGNYSSVCETGQDTVSIWSSVNTPITIPSIVAFGFANVITFIVKNSSNNPINSATVSIGDFVLSTDSEGVARATNIPNGLYTYTISADMYETKTGTINIYNNSSTVNETLLLIPIDAYAEESVVLSNPVKLNMGVGNSNTDYNVYASNTVITNELTLDAVAASTTEAGEIAQVELANPNIKSITVRSVDENNSPIDSNIEFNNSDDINEVDINVVAKDIYIAFIKGIDTMYFKNTTLPFISSENTFESTSYTYYTYENNIMIAHTATTSSVTSGGENTYNGITLNIDTSDSFSNGIWTRNVSEDLEIDNGDATITTSSYLTDVNPIIPRTDNFIFSCAKLNPAQWDTKLIIGGQEKQFIDNQEFYVKANQLIEIYATKHNSTDMKDIYNKYFHISNDKHYKKVNFVINVNVNDATIKFTINGVEFEYTGNTANIDCYEGETITWELSKTGFITQTGSYTVPSYPTISVYDEGTKTLVEE